MALNDVAITALKPKERDYLVAGASGLSIEVAVSGSKLWRFRYRFAERPRALSFSPYPEVSLKEARRRRYEARTVLRDGVDPGVERICSRVGSTTVTKRRRLTSTIHGPPTLMRARLRLPIRLCGILALKLTVMEDVGSMLKAGEWRQAEWSEVDFERRI